MKKKIQFLLPILMVALAIGVAGFAACNMTVSYQVTFNTGDGPAVEAQFVERGTSIELPTPDNYDHYRFRGWYDNADFSGDPIEGAYTPENSVTLYAKYTRALAYQVTLNMPDSVKIVDWEEGGIVDLAAEAEYNDGKYELLGWTDGSTDYAADATIVPTEDMTLTMKYNVYPYTYHLVEDPDGNYYEITELNDTTLTHLDIPTSFKDLPVKAIADNAFLAWNGTVTSVYVPDEIEYIGLSAFAGLYHLESADLPFAGTRKFTSIPNAEGEYPNEGGMFASLFCWMNQMSYDYLEYYRGDNFWYAINTVGSELVSSIDIVGVFVPESFKTVTIRGGMIADYAFANFTTLETVNIGAGVTSLGLGAFANHSTMNDEYDDFTEALATVNFAEDGVLTTIGKQCFLRQYNLSDITIPASVETIGEAAFSYCDSLSTLPFADGSALKSIGQQCFFYSGLASIDLPDLTSLGMGAFWNCANLTEIVIPASVTDLGAACFYDCPNLQSAIFAPGSPLTVIPHGTFENDYALTTYTLPDNITVIEDSAFRNCELIDEFDFTKITDIGDMAFSGTGLHTATFYPCLNSFGMGALSYCANLYEVTFSGTGYDGRINFESSAFADCDNLAEIVFPDGITQIGTRCFIGCAFPDITIPASVELIDDFAFARCENLYSVSYGAGSHINTIGANAFYMCQDLEEVEFPDGLETIRQAAFAQCNWLGEIYLPDSIINMGEAVFTPGFYTRIHLDIDIWDVPETWHANWCNGAFARVSYKTDVQPEPIEGYDYEGFSHETDYYITAYKGESETVVMPETIEVGGQVYNTKWQTGVFSGNEKIKHVTLPANMTKVPINFFEGCSLLETVTVPEGSVITGIGANAFHNCEKMTSCNIDFTNVVELGESAFEGCEVWDTTITLTDKLTNPGASAFAICKLLKFNFDGFFVENIPNYFFRWTSIEDYDFTGVVEIGDYAFDTCKSFKADGLLEIPDSVTYIGESAFSGAFRINKIIVGENVDYIGRRAFSSLCMIDRNLGNFYLEYTIIKGAPTTIGSEVFYGSRSSEGNVKVFFETMTIDTIIREPFPGYMIEVYVFPDGWSGEWHWWNSDGEEAEVYCKDDWTYDDNGDPVPGGAI